MRILATACLLLFTPLSATHILLFEELPTVEQQTQLFDLVLGKEPPSLFWDSTPIDLEGDCHNIIPSLSVEWVPPMLWQLGVLHSFFQDQEIRKGILACNGEGWDPLSYDVAVQSRLKEACDIDEIVKYFGQETRFLPNIVELFFQVNQALVSLYQRSKGSDLEFLRIVLSELPPFEEWPEREFPFWRSPWIYNPNSVELLYQALQDEFLLSELLKIERSAYKNGEWVLYRGYPGQGYPSTLEIDKTHNHALSFGSTLLGGIFFSLEACALAYSKSDTFIPCSFLALRVTSQEMKEVFRIGPLHPFIQMLVDGEMFHAHTKVSAKGQDTMTHSPIAGYFMKCNKLSYDPLGYVFNLEMAPDELEMTFQSLCKKRGTVFQDREESTLPLFTEEDCTDNSRL